MIGDRSHDMVGAKNNGMKGIGVLYGYGSRDELIGGRRAPCLRDAGSDPGLHFLNLSATRELPSPPQIRAAPLTFPKDVV